MIKKIYQWNQKPFNHRYPTCIVKNYDFRITLRCLINVPSTLIVFWKFFPPFQDLIRTPRLLIIANFNFSKYKNFKYKFIIYTNLYFIFKSGHLKSPPLIQTHRLLDFQGFSPTLLFGPTSLIRHCRVLNSFSLIVVFKIVKEQIQCSVFDKDP